MIDAHEAYRIGLVNKVVPAADLLGESEKMMRGIPAMARWPCVSPWKPSIKAWR